MSFGGTLRFAALEKYVRLSKESCIIVQKVGAFK